MPFFCAPYSIPFAIVFHENNHAISFISLIITLISSLCLFQYMFPYILDILNQLNNSYTKFNNIFRCAFYGVTVAYLLLSIFILVLNLINKIYSTLPTVILKVKVDLRF